MDTPINDIKDKISGYLEKKEKLNKSEQFFILQSLADEVKENILIDYEEDDEELTEEDPDDLDYDDDEDEPKEDDSNEDYEEDIDDSDEEEEGEYVAEVKEQKKVPAKKGKPKRIFPEVKEAEEEIRKKNYSNSSIQIRRPKIDTGKIDRGDF